MFADKPPRKCSDRALKLGLAVLGVTDAQSALTEAQRAVPSYTGQYSDADYVAGEQEAFYRACERLESVIDGQVYEVGDLVRTVDDTVGYVRKIDDETCYIETLDERFQPSGKTEFCCTSFIETMVDLREHINDVLNERRAQERMVEQGEINKARREEARLRAKARRAAKAAGQ